MTFKEYMSDSGYKPQTTFWNDFSMADQLGLPTVENTFKLAFREWKENYKFLTELVLVLNHKIWQHYKTQPELAKLYETLWKKTDLYAMENLKDEKLDYYYSVTD